MAKAQAKGMPFSFTHFVYISKMYRDLEDRTKEFYMDNEDSLLETVGFLTFLNHFMHNLMNLMLILIFE